MNLTYKTRKNDAAESESDLRCRICGAALKDSVVVETFQSNAQTPLFGFSVCTDHHDQSIKAAIRWQARWIGLLAEGVEENS